MKRIVMKFMFFSILNRIQSYDIKGYAESKETNTVVENRKASEPSFRSRHVVALVGFAVFLVLNIHRMNMTVSIVAMVKYSSSVRNTSIASQSCPELLYEQENSTWNVTKTGGEFDWSPKLQGYILGSSFVGFSITQFVAGKLAEIYGCKWILFGAVFVASITTFMTPFASWWNVYALIVVQTIKGMAQGMCPPAIMILIANWFPKLERGSFSTFILSGFGAGAVAGGLISGYLCDIPSAGWPAVFYSCGAGGLVLALVIATIIYENPSAHPNIHKNELKYILDNQEAKLDRKRPNTPWRSMLKSIPLYALMIAKFGTNWAGTYFLSLHPTFLGTILHFSISQNGLFTAIPFILQTSFILFASAASKIMNKNGRVSIDKSRKFWNSIGTLAGITSTFGSSSFFIFPVLVGFLTDGKQTLEQWKKIFCLTIGVVMISGVVFCFFGSAKVQDWNYVEEKKSKSDKRQIPPTHCETQS